MRDFLLARLSERSTAAGAGLLAAGLLGLSPEQSAQLSEGVTHLAAAFASLSPLAPTIAGALAMLWPTSGGKR